VKAFRNVLQEDRTFGNTVSAFDTCAGKIILNIPLKFVSYCQCDMWNHFVDFPITNGKISVL